MPAKILIIILILLSAGLSAQTGKPPAPVPADSLPPPPVVRVDSVVSDSTAPRIGLWKRMGRAEATARDFFQDDTPRPLKAMGLSLALPGLGQVYNGKHWKVPIVYAGVGGLGYAIAWNTKQYRRFRTAYIYRLDGFDETVDEFVDILEDDAIKNLRDNYRNDLELAYIGLAAFYILNAADAFVDAHLATFDVSEDLSIRIRPSLQSAAPGVGVSLGFK